MNFITDINWNDDPYTTNDAQLQYTTETHPIHNVIRKRQKYNVYHTVTFALCSCAGHSLPYLKDWAIIPSVFDIAL